MDGAFAVWSPFLLYMGVWLGVMVFAVVMVRRLVVGVERIAHALERGNR